ncbi:MAG: Ig-like domain-containing protein, partial [Methanobrevibacter sp.]|nr:Ig-like domain-containing protein [Methanobrevibacter sp.]
VDGVAVWTVSDVLDAGSYYYYAVWSGDDDYFGFNSSATSMGLVEVSKTSSNITINVGDIELVYNESVVLDATLMSEGLVLVGKTVVFYVDGGIVGYANTTSSGIASFVYVANRTGSFNWSASFEGDVDYAGCESENGTLIVTAAGSNITINVGDIELVYNESVVLNATLMSEGLVLVGKTVVFYVDGGIVGYANTSSSGIASFVYVANRTGSFNWSASFEGDGNYSGSESENGTLIVDKANTNLILIGDINSVYNSSVVLSATLSSNTSFLEGRNVTFYVNDVSVGVGLTGSDGVANFTYNTTTVGSFNWYAVFAEEVNYYGFESSNSTLTVDKANTSIILIGSISGVYNSSVVLSATLSSGSSLLEGRNVTFYVNGVSVGVGLTGSDGVAIFTYNTSTVGSFNWYAVFAEEVNYYGFESSNSTLVVNKASTTINVNNVNTTYGENLVLTATLISNNLNPLEGKIVNFYVNGSFVGNNTTDINGVARYSYVFNTSGTLTYHAVFEDDGNYTYSNTSALVNIAGLNTNIAPNNITGIIYSSVELLATLTSSGSPLANQTVFFIVNGVRIGNNTTDINGVAKFNYVFTTTGSLTYSVEYEENNIYTKSNAFAIVSITGLNTNINVNNIEGTINSPVELSATLTSNGSPLNNQRIFFVVNGVRIGNSTTDINGIAKYSYVFDKAGNQSYSVEYDGDIGYLSSKTSSNAGINIKKIIPELSISITEGKNGSYILKATASNKEIPLKGLIVQFYINDKKIAEILTDGDGSVFYEFIIDLTGVSNIEDAFYKLKTISSVVIKAVIIDPSGIYESIEVSEIFNMPPQIEEENPLIDINETPPDEEIIEAILPTADAIVEDENITEDETEIEVEDDSNNEGFLDQLDGVLETVKPLALAIVTVMVCAFTLPNMSYMGMLNIGNPNNVLLSNDLTSDVDVDDGDDFDSEVEDFKIEVFSEGPWSYLLTPYKNDVMQKGAFEEGSKGTMNMYPDKRWDKIEIIARKTGNDNHELMIVVWEGDEFVKSASTKEKEGIIEMIID